MHYEWHTLSVSSLRVRESLQQNYFDQSSVSAFARYSGSTNNFEVAILHDERFNGEMVLFHKARDVLPSRPSPGSVLPHLIVCRVKLGVICKD
jgi:hypothetical protein